MEADQALKLLMRCALLLMLRLCRYRNPRWARLHPMLQRSVSRRSLLLAVSRLPTGFQCERGAGEVPYPDFSAILRGTRL